MYKNILVAYDGSDGAKLALKKAIVIARESTATITTLWVRGTLPYFPETVDEIQEENAAAHSFHEKLQSDIDKFSKQEKFDINFVSMEGHPSKTIVEFALKNHTQLIVMGNSGHSNLWGNLLGHTTDKVSHHAPCDVLIVRKQK